jgi:ubiquinone biosynthesis protein COQ4
MTAVPSSPDRIRPLEAARALRALFRNKEDTAQVFRIIDATAGKTRRAAYRRAQTSEAGRALLAARPDLLAALSDRASLQALPTGTLGRTYFDFTYGENLTADGLVAASEAGSRYAGRPGEEAWFGARVRDQHDLWHVLTGYGREGFGELCLLAFTHAQTGNRGIGVLVLAGIGKWKRMMPKMPIVAAVREARARGRASAWFAETRWEDLLATPLDDVRALLRIPAAPVYARCKATALEVERHIVAAQAAPAQAA